jgi:arylsulfatase A-like enzyme
MDFDPRPFQPPPRLDTLYADAEIPAPPPESRARYDALPEFLKTSEGRLRWEHNFGTPELFQRNMRDYYRLITHMDEVIGRLRQAVADKGWAENTVFLYTGDNGYCIGDYGLEGKWYAYEPSIRTPLIIHDPRAGQPRRVNSMALNIDLAPTILDLAGLPIPEAMHGVSLTPHLRGESGTPREDWFYEHLLPHPRIPKSEGIRTARWKYIRWIEQTPVQEELYDLERDPLELRNLAPEKPAVLDSLRTRHAQYLEQLSPT